MSGLRIDARRTIATMCTELNAEFAIFEADDVRARLRARAQSRAVHADRSRRRRASTPRGARSTSARSRSWWRSPIRCLNNAVPVGEVAGTAIDQGFIGSCANGNLDDLAIAARVLAGPPASRRACAFSSRRARRRSTARRCKAGYIETFMEAGAVVTNPTCGACSGGHMGVLGAERDLHHREHPQQQGPHGRSERAHLHGLAGDGRGVRRDRRHHRSRANSSTRRLRSAS